MRSCLRRCTYSSSAAVTASFLVLCLPRSRASSMSLSSRARLVAMCESLHNVVCKTSAARTGEDYRKGGSTLFGSGILRHQHEPPYREGAEKQAEDHVPTVRAVLHD